MSLVDFHSDVKGFERWPPPHFDDITIEWKRNRQGRHGGVPFTIWDGKFQTPVREKLFDALPVESRTAHVRWIAPDVGGQGQSSANISGSPLVLGLAARGDHGFARRQHLMLPLVASGIGSLILESPFYGVRKPPQQQGAKLRRVSDLLVLGRVTIEESLLLLRKFTQDGHQRVGVSGLSMGGVHAAMVASLYPDPVALSMLLAPRSAASAYCRGALFHATDWDRLLRDSQGRESEIMAAIEVAATANERMAAARSLSRVSNSVERGVEPKEKEQQKVEAWRHWAAAGQWISVWSGALQQQLRKVIRLENQGGKERHAAAVTLMEAVLETFTDASRFPCPRRPDAAVLVAATEDAYVSPQSVLEMHKHLPGSEIRWVPGGHVSSFLLHQPTFRAAIKDSIAKL